MRLALHIVRLIGETVRFGAATHRVTLVLAIIIMLAILAIVLTTQVVAPIAVYPFA